MATVNGAGLVTAVTAGTTTITATVGGRTGTATVTVTNVPVATVTLTPAVASLTVGATVGGRCDFDNFVVSVAEGQTLFATVNTATGTACGASAPPLTLRLLASNGMVLGEGRTQGGNQCPSFGDGDPFATALPAGEYVVHVSTPQDEDAFDYSLDLVVQPPT